MLLKKKLSRGLILSTFLVMMSLKSFSQIATDTTSIQLTKPVAKLVIKDLMKGDGMAVELQTIQEILSSTNQKLATQTELVTNLNLQITNLESILSTKDEQINTSQELSKELEEALRKEKRLGRLYKLGSTVGIAAVALLLVQ
jgi:hypothetical protein